jgi:hypothetical protein
MIPFPIHPLTVHSFGLFLLLAAHYSLLTVFFCFLPLLVAVSGCRFWLPLLVAV